MVTAMRERSEKRQRKRIRFKTVCRQADGCNPVEQTPELDESMREFLERLEALSEAAEGPLPKPRKGFTLDGDTYTAPGRHGTYKISPMDAGKRKWSAQFTPKPGAKFKWKNDVIELDRSGWVNLWGRLEPKPGNLRTPDNAMKVAIKHNKMPLMGGDWPDEEQEPMRGRLS